MWMTGASSPACSEIKIMDPNKGKLIVIEGLDGSGKATQAKLLYEALRKQGKMVRAVSFPDYESDSSALVKMYLNGQFGTRPDDVNAYAASSFFAVDRYASFKKDWETFYRSGGIIVADRYTTSNAVHQCSKLPENEWPGFLDWLFRFEFQLLGIPEPDTVVYLRVDTSVTHDLLLKRYDGDESREDIHEGDANYMSRSQKAAEYCSKTLGWTAVSCVQDGRMRSIEDIHDEIMSTLSL